jgi:hypothetical protein
MEEKNDILSDWKLRSKPPIPVGFFDQFLIDLMNRINEESGFLGQLKKSKKPELPAGYFDTLPLSFESEPTSFSLDNLEKTDLPKLPPNYFEDFESKIMAAVDQDKKGSVKRTRIIPMRVLAVITSVAAAILLIVSIIDFTTDPELVIPVAETEEDVYDTYLTYLDESDIIDYIIDNDIDLEDTTDQIQDEDYFDYSEADIEDYYLELL